MAAEKDVPMTALNARIPTDLHKQLRVEAINRGATVQELVAEAIRRLLADKPDTAKRK